jgi:hypothetical protein
MASRLPEAVRIIATDLNQPMLDHAAMRQARNRRIEWKQGDCCDPHLQIPAPIDPATMSARKFHLRVEKSPFSRRGMVAIASNDFMA